MNVSVNAFQLQEQITELVQSVAGQRILEPLTIETNILESKLVDSFGLLQLVADIENVFGIKIEPEHLTLENFSSISGMVSLVSCHLIKS